MKPAVKTAAAIVVIGLIALAAMTSRLGAAPPADADPALAPWFNSLTDGNGVSCCSMSDCRGVDVRAGAGGWEVHIQAGKFPGAERDEWVPVPAEKVLRRDNPLGRAAVCWTARARRHVLRTSRDDLMRIVCERPPLFDEI